MHGYCTGLPPLPPSDVISYAQASGCLEEKQNRAADLEASLLLCYALSLYFVEQSSKHMFFSSLSEVFSHEVVWAHHL